MWPAILAVGGLAALLFGTKSKGKTGATVLAESTTKYGQPIGTQNWPAPTSGRIYRVTHWQTAKGRIVLVVAGSGAAQPSAPDAYWLVSNPGTGWTVNTSSVPDATAKSDFANLQQSFPA